MSPTRVLVTGLGVTTPVGGDVASTWDALLAGRSGVNRLEHDLSLIHISEPTRPY